MSTTRSPAKTAKDVMTPEPICATTEMTIREFARLLDEYEVSGTPVTDSSGRLIGVASKSDLLHRALDPDLGVEPKYIFETLYATDEDDEDREEDGEAVAESPVLVGDFMTEDPVTATPDEAITSLAKKMIDGHIHRVIVIDEEERPVGIVTSLDMLKVLRD